MHVKWFFLLCFLRGMFSLLIKPFVLPLALAKIPGGLAFKSKLHVIKSSLLEGLKKLYNVERSALNSFYTNFIDNLQTKLHPKIIMVQHI